jgi:hypothetical protein
MLKILAGSCIPCESQKLITFRVNNPEYQWTGRWSDDSANIQIVIPQQPGDGVLIMGLGPSASGKTASAKTILGLLSKTMASFPTRFMTIDGGTYREMSFFYQAIVSDALLKGYAGLSNLVSSIGGSYLSLFDSGKIKKQVIQFLQAHPTIKFNLYIPDTMWDKKKMQTFKALTNGQTIGLLIYQHVHGGDQCPFQSPYTCVGCTESGKAREGGEGKAYSNFMYPTSMQNGLQWICKAGTKLVYHNSGRREGKAIIWDISQSLQLPSDPNTPYYVMPVSNNTMVDSSIYKDNVKRQEHKCGSS